MRRALLSVAVGLAIAGGIAASGWALQTATLPSPKPADRVAADASAWFHDYRLVIDVFHIDHRRIKGACLRGWFPREHRGNVRGALLSLRPGPVLFVSANQRVTLISGQRNRILRGRLAAAAGCSGSLAPALARAAQTGQHLTIERSYAAGEPAIVLEIQQVGDERLTLYVSPRTYRPLVANVVLEGEVATARLYLNRIRSGLLTRFHLPHTAAKPSL